MARSNWQQSTDGVLSPHFHFGELRFVPRWRTGGSRQGLSHLITQRLPTHEKEKKDEKKVLSDEISGLVRQQRGYGDHKCNPKWHNNTTPLQTHLSDILHLYFAPAHFHTESGFIMVVSEMFRRLNQCNYNHSADHLIWRTEEMDICEVRSSRRNFCWRIKKKKDPKRSLFIH